MGDIMKQTVVEAPAHKVYSYIVDPRNAPRYISSISSIVSGPEGTPKKGDSWRAEATFFGQKRLLNLRLDDMVADKGVRFVLEGDPQAILVLKLAPGSHAESTSVSLILDVESVPTIFLNGLLGGLLNEDMARLKRNLEE